ncbi:early growth response protein 1-like isoform X2 [Mercenaria mercenaria]|uniref:early growth response protein 1-like isoform X2 n=1 Tax=Mercenaria mercenaria TaxID=6596 RepID=UPI00234F7ECB|nr:early growth response protein 1-like isoform X2 [Mercenaria mercenaria]
MAAPDLDVIKDIPGYKVILKAVVKNQIQQLVEQLAAHTDEESIILTASVADGTLSHIGSESGKSFLEDNEDVKSQFLGFCLKYHHKKKQQEKEKERLLQEQQQLQLQQQQLQQQQLQQMMSPSRFSGGPRFMPSRSPRQYSPRFSSRSPGMRHEPYPSARPPRRPLNLDQASGANKNTGAMKIPIGNNGQVIKIEPEDDESSNQSATDTTNVPSASGTAGTTQPSASPSHSSAPSTPANVKSESGDKDDDDNKSESSATGTTPQPTTEGLNLQSDLSDMISSGGDNSDLDKAGTSAGAEGTDSEPFNVKLEAISESDMELEITGVEPGRPAVPQYDVSMGMPFDPSTSGIDSPGQQGYSVLQGRQFVPDYLQEGAELSLTMEQGEQLVLDKQNVIMSDPHKKFICPVCNKGFTRPNHVTIHMQRHTGERPFECHICGKKLSRMSTLREHMVLHLNK